MARLLGHPRGRSASLGDATIPRGAEVEPPSRAGAVAAATAACGAAWVAYATLRGPPAARLSPEMEAAIGASAAGRTALDRALGAVLAVDPTAAVSAAAGLAGMAAALVAGLLLALPRGRAPGRRAVGGGALVAAMPAVALAWSVAATLGLGPSAVAAVVAAIALAAGRLVPRRREVAPAAERCGPLRSAAGVVLAVLLVGMASALDARLRPAPPTPEIWFGPAVDLRSGVAPWTGAATLALVAVACVAAERIAAAAPPGGAAGFVLAAALWSALLAPSGPLLGLALAGSLARLVRGGAPPAARAAVPLLHLTLQVGAALTG